MDPLQKYLYVDAVQTLLTVSEAHGSNARLRMYQKDGFGWVLALDCPAFIGRDGLGKTKEGDMKTPVGDFGLLCAFGIKANPGTRLPWVDVDDNIWCCGDEVAYNRIIDIQDCPHDCKGEHLIEYGAAYHYGIFPDYNRECVPGKGSAIFLHCFGRNPYTAGCVAVSEENMIAILRACDLNSRMVILE